MADLTTNVRYIKGVGEQRAKALNKLGITTLRDLISYFPRSYEDRSLVTPIAGAADDRNVLINALIVSTPRVSFIRKGMELLKFRCADDSGTVDVTYFNQSYLKNSFHEGDSCFFYGKLTGTGARRAMTNPVFEQEARAGQVTGRIVPVYRLTAGVSQKLLMTAVRSGLDNCSGALPDALPEQVRERCGLAQSAFAYENIHFPKDLSALELARRRLIFEELFVLADAVASFMFLTKSDNERFSVTGSPDIGTP